MSQVPLVCALAFAAGSALAMDLEPYGPEHMPAIDTAAARMEIVSTSPGRAEAVARVAGAVWRLVLVGLDVRQMSDDRGFRPFGEQGLQVRVKLYTGAQRTAVLKGSGAAGATYAVEGHKLCARGRLGGCHVRVECSLFTAKTQDGSLPGLRRTVWVRLDSEDAAPGQYVFVEQDVDWNGTDHGAAMRVQTDAGWPSAHKMTLRAHDHYGYRYRSLPEPLIRSLTTHGTVYWSQDETAVTLMTDPRWQLNRRLGMAHERTGYFTPKDPTDASARYPDKVAVAFWPRELRGRTDPALPDQWFVFHPRTDEPERAGMRVWRDVIGQPLSTWMMPPEEFEKYLYTHYHHNPPVRVMGNDIDQIDSRLAQWRRRPLNGSDEFGHIVFEERAATPGWALVYSYWPQWVRYDYAPDCTAITNFPQVRRPGDLVPLSIFFGARTHKTMADKVEDIQVQLRIKGRCFEPVRVGFYEWWPVKGQGKPWPAQATTRRDGEWLTVAATLRKADRRPGVDFHFEATLRINGAVPADDGCIDGEYSYTTPDGKTVRRRLEDFRRHQFGIPRWPPTIRMGQACNPDLNVVCHDTQDWLLAGRVVRRDEALQALGHVLAKHDATCMAYVSCDGIPDYLHQSNSLQLDPDVLRMPEPGPSRYSGSVAKYYVHAYNSFSARAQEQFGLCAAALARSGGFGIYNDVFCGTAEPLCFNPRFDGPLSSPMAGKLWQLIRLRRAFRDAGHRDKLMMSEGGGLMEHVAAHGMAWAPCLSVGSKAHHVDTLRRLAWIQEAYDFAGSRLYSNVKFRADPRLKLPTERVRGHVLAMAFPRWGLAAQAFGIDPVTDYFWRAAKRQWLEHYGRGRPTLTGTCLLEGTPFTTVTLRSKQGTSWHLLNDRPAHAVVRHELIRADLSPFGAALVDTFGNVLLAGRAVAIAGGPLLAFDRPVKAALWRRPGGTYALRVCEIEKQKLAAAVAVTIGAEAESIRAVGGLTISVRSPATQAFAFTLTPEPSHGPDDFVHLRLRRPPVDAARDREAPARAYWHPDSLRVVSEPGREAAAVAIAVLANPGPALGSTAVSAKGPAGLDLRVLGPTRRDVGPHESWSVPVRLSASSPLARSRVAATFTCAAGHVAAGPLTVDLRLRREVPIDYGWRFAHDAEGRGEEWGWHRAQFVDTAWRTVDAGFFWTDQIGKSTGIGWYRHRGQTRLLKGHRPRRVLLHFDGFEGRTRVFVDGRLIGEGKRRGPKEWAHDFDVTAVFGDLAAHTIAVASHWHPVRTGLGGHVRLVLEY